MFETWIVRSGLVMARAHVSLNVVWCRLKQVKDFTSRLSETMSKKSIKSVMYTIYSTMSRRKD